VSTYDAAPQQSARTTNGKATWSLVLGILSLTLCGIIAAILAIVLGKQAQREIAASGGLQGGESMAKWGIILGWISVALSVIALIVAVIIGVVAWAGN
jgi:hypothetical protein